MLVFPDIIAGSAYSGGCHPRPDSTVKGSLVHSFYPYISDSAFIQRRAYDLLDLFTKLTRNTAFEINLDTLPFLRKKLNQNDTRIKSTGKRKSD